MGGGRIDKNGDQAPRFSRIVVTGTLIDGVDEADQYPSHMTAAP